MTRPEGSVADKIKSLHDAGWSITELSTLFGVGPDVVEKIALEGQGA